MFNCEDKESSDIYMKAELKTKMTLIYSRTLYLLKDREKRGGG